VLAVLAVQPVDCFVQIFRYMAKAFLTQSKMNALSRKNFFIIVDNSCVSSYYRIKRFGFFQGAAVFEVKGSSRKGRAFCFTSNIYVRTPVGPFGSRAPVGTQTPV
jgi:hypothetical protein